MPDEEQIFAAALSRSSEDERASYLAQACDNSLFELLSPRT